MRILLRLCRTTLTVGLADPPMTSARAMLDEKRRGPVLLGMFNR
jgi:hypothetical protein